MPQLKRIVIVGGGIAGILLATKLGNRLGRSEAAAITLIDSSPSHIWKPMLHTIAAGTRDVQQQQVIYLSHAREHGFTYQPGEMQGLDRANRRVRLGPIRSAEGEVVLEARAVEYDVLVLALGSFANDFGTPGVTQNCHFIDSQAQAQGFNLALRERVFRSVAKNEPLRVAIVGAGATGVELAAELSHVLDLASSYGDPTVRERLTLTVIESGQRVLASFPSEISASAQERLERIGFRVLTSTKVTSAEPGGFRYGEGSGAGQSPGPSQNEESGRSRNHGENDDTVAGNGGLVAADLMVWAAGVKAPDFLQQIDGLETQKSNQLLIKPTLQTTQDASIFAIGDCSSLTPEGCERALPPTAQVATQQAEFLAKHLPAWLDGKALPAFAFHDFGSLVALSDYDAFGTLGKFGFFHGGFIRGRLAQLSHAMLYRRHQQELHGLGKASLLWAAERINGMVQPKIRLT